MKNLCTSSKDSACSTATLHRHKFRLTQGAMKRLWTFTQGAPMQCAPGAIQEDDLALFDHSCSGEQVPLLAGLGSACVGFKQYSLSGKAVDVNTHHVVVLQTCHALRPCWEMFHCCSCFACLKLLPFHQLRVPFSLMQPQPFARVPWSFCRELVCRQAQENLGRFRRVLSRAIVIVVIIHEAGQQQGHSHCPVLAGFTERVPCLTPRSSLSFVIRAWCSSAGEPSGRCVSTAAAFLRCFPASPSSPAAAWSRDSCTQSEVLCICRASCELASLTLNIG